MIYLYKQEIFKLLRRKSTLYSLIYLVFQNITVAVLSKIYPQHIDIQEMFADNFVSISFIVFIMIAATATIIASEFEYNTIKNIVYQSYPRRMILMSKWMAMLTYSISLYLLMMLLSLVNKFVLFGGDYSLTDKVHHNSFTLWQYFLTVNITNFVTMWLLLSVVFLLSSLMRKGATAITVGIIGYFAISIIGNFMFVLIGKWDFLKWNPINFMNYPAQMTATGLVPKLTHLTNNEMLLGNIGYILLFLTLGLYFFSRKEV